MLYNTLETASALSFEFLRFTPVLSPFKWRSKIVFRYVRSDIAIIYDNIKKEIQICLKTKLMTLLN